MERKYWWKIWSTIVLIDKSATIYTNATINVQIHTVAFAVFVLEFIKLY